MQVHGSARTLSAKLPKLKLSLNDYVPVPKRTLLFFGDSKMPLFSLAAVLSLRVLPVNPLPSALLSGITIIIPVKDPPAEAVLSKDDLAEDGVAEEPFLADAAKVLALDEAELGAAGKNLQRLIERMNINP